MTIMDSELVQFAARVIEQHGGVTEVHSAENAAAIVPHELARMLETPEEFTLGGDAAPLLYGSPFLDRLVQFCTKDIPLLYGHVDAPYLKKEGFDRLLGADILFADCQARLGGRAETRLSYLVLTCRYVALSDERKEGVVTVAVRETDGAVIDGFSAGLSALQPQWYPAAAVPHHQFQADMAAATASALRCAQVEAHAGLADFFASMQRRLRRDAQNTREYYAALGKEMQQSLERSGLGDAQRRERQEKLDGLSLEMGRKIQDLSNKYRVQVRLSAAAAMRLLVNVAQVTAEIRYRSLARSLPLTWNPLTRRFDPLVCERCGGTTRSAYPYGEKSGVKFNCFDCRRKG